MMRDYDSRSDMQRLQDNQWAADHFQWLQDLEDLPGRDEAKPHPCDRCPDYVWHGPGTAPECARGYIPSVRQRLTGRSLRCPDSDPRVAAWERRTGCDSRTGEPFSLE